jgi:pteridine reductase
LNPSGKLAVITGGAGRIGQSLVETAAAIHAKPVIHYFNSRDKAESLAKKHKGWAIQADLSKPQGAEELVAAVSNLPGKLALWVNNASGFERRKLDDSDDALWQETMQLNLLSPVSTARGAARLLIDGGLIVNILDIAAYQPWKGFAHHCVSKAGLAMATRSLAVELGPRLRVCGIIPGAILPSEQLDDSEQERLVSRIPAQRRGTPSEVAQALRHLIEADYMTGSAISVDGGLLATSFRL